MSGPSRNSDVQPGRSAARPLKPPGFMLLSLGVLFPAMTILLEWFFGFCANELFDPLPTFWHLLVAATVPAANFMVWQQLRDEAAPSLDRLRFVNATVWVVAGLYTLPFIPLLPLSIFLVFLLTPIMVFAPLSAWIVAIKLYRNHLRPRLDAHSEKTGPRPLWLGLLCGLLLVASQDMVLMPTLLGVKWGSDSDVETRERGLWLLRHLGDETYLRRLGRFRRTTIQGPLLLVFSNQTDLSPARAHTLHYRVTGHRFNDGPPANPDRFTFLRQIDRDFDQGGDRIGARQNGLRLEASRLDGSLSATGALAYLEWTLAFENDSNRQREARALIALPPGGVVSRATLWVAGEEREAVFAGRAETSKAYKEVVRRRRDPLLVTSRGPDRIFAQAFPIPAGEGLKFRLGITAPIRAIAPDRGELLLPILIDENFHLPTDAIHAVWFESKDSLDTPLSSLLREPAGDNGYRLRGTLSDRELRSPQARIGLPLPVPAPTVWTPDPGDEQKSAILQEWTAPPPTPVDRLMIVIDGSHGLAGQPMIHRFKHIFSTIPPGLATGLVIAGDRPMILPVAPWDGERKKNWLRTLREYPFEGGRYNAAALTEAVNRLAATEQGMILWIHGPQPVTFETDKMVLEQLLDRLPTFPRLIDLALIPGENLPLADTGLKYHSRRLTRLEIAPERLTDTLTALWPGKPMPETRQRRLPLAELPEATGSWPKNRHIAALWAKREIDRLLRGKKPDSRKRAIELATAHRLITPVSGAVVLETDADYEANDLAPNTVGTVPTIPEPETWLLLIAVLLALTWHFRRRLRWPLRHPQP